MYVMVKGGRKIDMMAYAVGGAIGAGLGTQLGIG